MADPVRPGRTYRFWAACLYVGLRLFFRMRVRGAGNVPRTGGCILAANHASFLDPPMLGSPVRFRQVHFMARESLFRFPVLRTLLPRLGVIPLRPQSGDVAALRAGVRALRAGDALGLFPEGTRSPDGRLHPALGGIGFLVAHGRAPVVPVFIEGAFRAWPRHRRLPRPRAVAITYGPPIPPERIAACGTGPEGYARIARLVMEEIARIGGVAPPADPADGESAGTRVPDAGSAGTDAKPPAPAAESKPRKETRESRNPT